jgi:hypothetical protein
MRRLAVILGFAAVVVGAAELAAQEKPNFAGKWTMVPDPAAPPPTGCKGKM